ncbi:hypothetical protein GOODEAATRI_021959, partial [Goodea atripinnis]
PVWLQQLLNVSLQEIREMKTVLRLAAVAVPMGVLLSRTMAWMSSGKTHPELIGRLRGREMMRKALGETIRCQCISSLYYYKYCLHM